MKEKQFINLQVDKEFKEKLLSMAEKYKLPLASFIKYVLANYIENEGNNNDKR